MSSPKSVQLLSSHPEWSGPLEALAAQVERMSPDRRLKPREIAREAGIPAWQALGILKILQEAGLGEVRLQVRDSSRGGVELGTYRSAEDIPWLHPDALGEMFQVQPEDVQLVFVPAQGLRNVSENSASNG